MSSEMISLLRALVQITGRTIYDDDGIKNIIGAKNKKLLKAYNLCDGTRTQQEVVKAAKLDPGNFSRTVVRWKKEGIVFRIDHGDCVNLLHVFPL